MTPRLEAAEYVHGYTIRLRFGDGIEGDVDFRDQLWGEVFEPLKSTDAFRNFRLDHELNTISWPSGADFAPEFLYACTLAQQADAAGRRSAGR